MTKLLPTTSALIYVEPILTLVLDHPEAVDANSRSTKRKRRHRVFFGMSWGWALALPHRLADTSG